MKKLYFIMTILMFGFISNSSYAELKTTLDQTTTEFGKTFIPLASQFGMTEYVYATNSQYTIALFEYLPKGQKLENWKDLSTITLTGVPQDKIKDVLPFFIKQMSKNGGGKAIHDQDVLNSGEKGVGYVHYSIGTGAVKEENLSMIWQVVPGVIAQFQIQKRQGKQSEETIKKFKNLVKETANKK